MMRKLVCFLTVALLAGFIAACGQTGIRNTTVRAPTNVARPERILVYDFAVNAQEVKEYQGIMRQQPTIKDAAERERLLAQEVKDARADELSKACDRWDFASSGPSAERPQPVPTC